MIGKFQYRKSDGSWSDEYVDWETHPFKTIKQNNR